MSTLKPSSVAKAGFCHFGTDIEGSCIVSDYVEADGAVSVCYGRLGTPGEDPMSGLTFLAKAGRELSSPSHAHPFCSPDGTMAFFNSAESGVLQAYMLRGLELI